MSTIRQNVAMMFGIGMAISSAAGCAVQSDEAMNEEPTTTQEQAVLGTYRGCRGTALHVCDELVDPYYFTLHPTCKSNPTCEGRYYTCDTACPAPGPTETPNAKIKTSGASTAQANIMVGYVWSSCTGSYCTGGLHSASVEQPRSWTEFNIGAGVYVPAGKDVVLRCNNNQSDRRLTGLSIVWTDGTNQTVACDDWYCQADVPLRTGLTATCNFALK